MWSDTASSLVPTRIARLARLRALQTELRVPTPPPDVNRRLEYISAFRCAPVELLGHCRMDSTKAGSTRDPTIPARCGLGSTVAVLAPKSAR